MLRQLWQSWLVQARHIGHFQARALITLVYFTLLLPFGLLVVLFSDPLLLRPRDQRVSAWLPRETRDRTLEDARRQG
ncbi:MAG: hypothetical protein GXP42_06975 [Chloroflexi bacterium]|nr:hypothetical protein [Chloroflexota bacterium]